MIITIKEVMALLPILILGITVITILLSIAYNRNNFFHAVLTIVGLCSAMISLVIIWNYQDTYNFCELIYIDNFVIFYTMLILISSTLSVFLAYKWLLRYLNNRIDEFYLLLLVSSIGGILLTMTNHLVILFLSLELLSLPLFGLIGYSLFNKYSLEASIKYIVLSGVSSSFFLLGIALVYIDTGCLLFTDINQSLLMSRSVWLYQPVLVVGLCIMMISFGFKLSCVPFHLWTPDVYQGASYPVSMYLATSNKIAIISILIRFFLIFPNQYNEIFHIFFSGIACFSILFGNIMAVQQSSIKRVLAYSSIVHTGYLLIGLIVLKKNPIVFESIGIYLISYLIANIAIFSIIGIISNENEINNEDADGLYLYQGLFWKQPILSVIFTIVLLSLAGMPMTVGFIGKFYLFTLGISDQLWCLTICMIIGSVIGMFYYLKIMISLYLRPKGNVRLYSTAVAHWMFTSEGVIVLIFTFFVLFLGLYPQPMIFFMHSFL